MSLKLYYHPLSSYCWKVLIALYENQTPFEPQLVDLMEEKSRKAFLQIWPLGKFPVLRDEMRDAMVPESSIILEYLDQHYPGKVRFLPSDPDVCRQTRFHDRFYDLYVHEPMQKMVFDKMRPEGQKDALGVQQAKARLETALGMIERHMNGKTWVMGEAFTLADCAAAPALFYADKFVPLGKPYPNVASYLERLKARPSFARVLQEAQPYFHLFPG
ncbi:MAG: glutathione S-transferase family protein [bacterium]